MSKLDLETRLYLYITRARIKKHEKVEDVQQKKNFPLDKLDIHDVFVFKDYEEFKKYFFMYLDEVNEELINLAIYTKGKDGQIVALRALCERIISGIKQIEDEEYDESSIYKALKMIQY